MTDRLHSAELRLRIMGGEAPRRVTGYHVHAFILRLIDRVNSSLAARLHADGGAPKPFTLSPLALAAPARRDAPTEGSVARIRLTFLQEEVLAALLDAVWRLPAGVTLPLGGLAVGCEGVLTTPEQSPWAAFATFSELLDGAGDERKLRLSFLSPTTFRSKGQRSQRNVIVPEPALVWGSLLARWNAFAPSSDQLTLGDPGALMRLSAYHLSTRMLDFGGYQEVGFRGWAAYELSDRSTRDEVRACHALSAFALYSGIGAKTTMGMGQATRAQPQDAEAVGARGPARRTAERTARPG